MKRVIKENAIRIVMTLGAAAIIVLIGVYFTVMSSAIADDKVAAHEKVTSVQLNGHGTRISDLEMSMVKVVTIQQEQSKTFTDQLNRFDKVLIRFENRLNRL